MTEQEGVNPIRKEVEAEFQSFKDSNPGMKYPYFHYLDHFYGLFVPRGKRSREQFEGTHFMTPYLKKLYEDADQALGLEKIEKRQIQAFVEQSFQAFERDDDDGYMASREEMTQMLWPVYVRMRELGYPHTDLY